MKSEQSTIVSEDSTAFPEPSPDGPSALERLLQRIEGATAFPIISRHLVEINQKLAINPDHSNATDLANVILKDHGLTGKLLKLVNSAYYTLAAGKVCTVTRAVVVLGYENVRLATLSLALFEHFKGKSNAKDLKETMVASFWSGVMARQLASMEKSVDPEEAFISAMMSHLGKLVMIYYLPDIHHRIRTCMADEKVDESTAVKAVCGVTYDQLGIAVAKQWHFPSQICDAMQMLSRRELQKNDKVPPLRAISCFMRELCEWVSSNRWESDKKYLQNLLERYQPHIAVTRKQLQLLVKDSLENVHQHARALSLNIAESHFLERLAVISEYKRPASTAESKPEPSDHPNDNFHLVDEDRLKTDPRIAPTRNPNDIIMEGIQELSQIMIADYDVDTIAAMSLEILYRALDFQRALMFVRDGDGKSMLARFGYGQNCHRLTGRLHFKLDRSKDLFNLSIRVGKDLVVADSYDQQMNQLIPSWYRDKIDAPSFVFLPIIFQKVCIGALYADRDTAGLPVSETEHRYLGLLRNQLILSIKHKHKAP